MEELGRSIKVLSEQVSPAALHLEVRFSEKYYVSVWAIVPRDADYLRPGYKGHILDIYEKLIHPMTALKGLKSFFVHLNWGSTCGDINGRKWLCGTWSIPYADGRALEEQKLERMVMGPEYDAWECSKQIRIDVGF